MTSLAISLGPNSLLQLGVSLSDIALIVNYGKKFGNFLRASSNDDDLLRSINENPEAVLKRRGLIEKARMESKWSRMEFIYEGEKIDNAEKGFKDEQNLTTFSWFMVAIVSALDLCLSKDRLSALLNIVLSKVLERESEIEESLRILLPTNIESWRSVGKVRRMNLLISRTYSQTRQKLVQGEAIPQLNLAEFQEMVSFLVWLMKGESNTFKALSVDTSAVAAALRTAGIMLRTEGQRGYETEPYVEYRDESDPVDIGLAKHHPSEYKDPLRLQRGNRRIVQQVSYPHRRPFAMIQSIPASRDTLNKMEYLWELGSRAAASFWLVGEAESPYTTKSEVFYRLEGLEPCHSRFPPDLCLLADHAFPVASEGILMALEKLIEGLTTERIQWLNQYTGLEYLTSGDSKVPSRRREDMDPWLQYQALVFGFYYRLLEPLVAFDLVEEDTYFQGLWGYGSTTFLAMCAQFGQTLRKKDPLSRPHVLYMLASMYSGRQKTFVPGSRHGMLGIIGSISVVSMPLLRRVDTPEEVCRFIIADLPVIDFAPESDGELFATTGTGIEFDQQPVKPSDIIAHGPAKKWSLHAKMGVSFEGGENGIVMAARCSGRLVGWFNPLAADVTFLSTAYLKNEVFFEENKDFTVRGFEIRDEDWQNGRVPRPIEENSDNVFGVVHSCGCPALRYAAAGVFGGVGEEVVISTGNLEMAFGRVEAQVTGIIIG